MHVRTRLGALLLPVSVVGALIAAQAPVHAADPAPTVTNEPTTGSYASDQGVYVESTGTGSTADLPLDFTLIVDGDAAHPVDELHCQTTVSPTSCSVELEWVPTVADDGQHHTLQVRMTTTNGVISWSDVKTLTVIKPLTPKLTVSHPPIAADATGTVDVTITGTVDPTYGDHGRNIVLFYNIGDYSKNFFAECTTQVCSFTVPMSAADVLSQGYQVTFGTQQTSIDRGAAPLVFLTSPATGDTVQGVTQVTATASVATMFGDRASSLYLLVDGTKVGNPVACSGAWSQSQNQKCDVSFAWDTSGLAPGKHTVAVGITTEQSSGASVAASVNVGNVAARPATLAVAPGGTWVRGASGYVSGTVTDASTHAGLGGVPVTVTFTPYNGSPASVTVLSESTGYYRADNPSALTSNTKVSVSTSADFPATAVTTTQSVTVPISCVVPSSVQHGVAVTIRCTATGLAWHSVVALRITGGSIPHATQFGKVDSHGNVSFSQTFSHPSQSLTVRATTASTNTYAASTSKSYSLTVH